ncbi:hypothetical protein [Singulisphaera sp. PoT]|uniref:hypothetical protein n=1 Tax=Singulisphaera sp. PoT TaxID=3411797 RepID=UPI003BF4FB3B
MGILCRWKTANGNVWTLTPFAAKVIGVELVEHVEPASEKGFTCRWEPIGKQLRPLRVPASWRSLSISNPDALIAPADPEGYLCDESTGERILLFGKFPIKIDSRLARTKRRRRRAG